VWGGGRGAGRRRPAAGPSRVHAPDGPPGLGHVSVVGNGRRLGRRGEWRQAPGSGAAAAAGAAGGVCVGGVGGWGWRGGWAPHLAQVAERPLRRADLALAAAQLVRELDEELAVAAPLVGGQREDAGQVVALHAALLLAEVAHLGVVVVVVVVVRWVRCGAVRCGVARGAVEGQGGQLCSVRAPPLLQRWRGAARRRASQPMTARRGRRGTPTRWQPSSSRSHST
jgi:hypothetical protein